MDQSSQWNSIIARKFSRQLALDIEHCSLNALYSVILDVRTPAPLLDEIAQAYCGDEDVLRALVRCPNLAKTTLAFIAMTGPEDMKSFIAATRGIDVVVSEASAPAEEEKKLNVMQLIMRMNPAQKIKLALRGDKEARGLLIRESSKIIALSVLANPRLTIGEVEFFAKSQNLSEDVIRKIGTNLEWSRKPSIYTALVYNPKTPVSTSIGFINRLSVRDLAILERSRNIPAAVRSAARSLVAKKKFGK